MQHPACADGRWAVESRSAEYSPAPAPRPPHRRTSRGTSAARRRRRPRRSAPAPVCRWTTTSPTAARRSSSRSPACPRPRRRTASARCSSTSAARAARRPTPARPAGPDALHGAQRALRHHRHRPARRRAERAADRLQGQPGDRGHLLAAVHDAADTSTRRAGRQGPALHRAVPALNAQILPHVSTANVARDIDLIRQAPRRRASSPTSASPTARSSGRRTRACSRTATARWCSTAPVDADAYINDPIATC